MKRFSVQDISLLYMTRLNVKMLPCILYGNCPQQNQSASIRDRSKGLTKIFPRVQFQGPYYQSAKALATILIIGHKMLKHNATFMHYLYRLYADHVYSHAI